MVLNSALRVEASWYYKSSYTWSHFGLFSNSMSRSHLVTMTDQEKLIYSDDDAGQSSRDYQERTGQSSSEGTGQRSGVDTEQSPGRDRHSRRHPNKRPRQEQRTLERDDRILKELEKICSGVDMIESSLSIGMQTPAHFLDPISQEASTGRTPRDAKGLGRHQPSR